MRIRDFRAFSASVVLVVLGSAYILCPSEIIPHTALWDGILRTSFVLSLALYLLTWVYGMKTSTTNVSTVLLLAVGLFGVFNLMDTTDLKMPILTAMRLNGLMLIAGGGAMLFFFGLNLKRKSAV